MEVRQIYGIRAISSSNYYMFSKSFVSNVVKLNPYSYQTAKQYIKGNFKNIISVMEREKKTNPTEKMAWNENGLKTVGFGFSYKITSKKFTTSYSYITILK